MKQKDARTLTGTGIVIWVMMVLFYWMFTTGVYQPAFLVQEERYFVPVLIFSLMGGLFVTAGFLMERNRTQGVAELHSSLEGKPSFSVRKSVPAVVSRGSWVDRAAVWVGSIMLLLPVFILLYGLATGLYFAANVEEMTVVSALFFWPIGFLMLVCGIQNLVEPKSKAAKILDGLFLLACVIAGPLGILLYIARYLKQRDNPVAGNPEQPPVTSGEDPFVREHRRSNKRVILGVVIAIGLLLGAILSVQIWRHLNTTEHGYLLNWGLNLLVVSPMLIAAYFLRRKGAEAASRNPWIALEWITILVACLMLLALVFPTMAQSDDERVILTYRGGTLISNISVEADDIYQVHSWPFELKMKPGRHYIKTYFLSAGRPLSITTTIQKQEGKPLHVDLTNQILTQAGGLPEPPASPGRETPPDRSGAILISGQTPFLRVGIFPVPAPDGGGMMMGNMGMGGGFGGPKVYGFSDDFYTLEPMTHELPAGKYLIKVSSTLAGWEGKYSTPQYDLAEVEVEPGEIVSVTIKPDYSKLVESHPNWYQGGLFKFHWGHTGQNNLKIYTLSLPQALIVQELLQAYAEGKPDIAESVLLTVAQSKNQTETPKSLEAIFNKGQHPAWKSLIVPGAATGTWRLVEQMLKGSVRKKGGFGGGAFENNHSSTQQQQQRFEVQGAGGTPPSSQQPLQARKPRLAGQYGAIVIFGKDPGMRIDLERKQKSGPNGRIMKRFQHGASTFDVTPGEYVIKVSTQLIGWELTNRSAHYIDSELNVKAGETIEKTLHYNFQKLAENHPVWEADQHFHFNWFSPDMDRAVGFTSSPEQAQTIQVLLEAFAADKPDVSETRLLSVANQSLKSTAQQKSMEELFPSGWKQLIVPGKTEKTWRLVDPQFNQKPQTLQPKAF